MAHKIISWANEEIDASLDIPTVSQALKTDVPNKPDIQTQGSQAADMDAPAGGELFEESRHITGDKIELEESAAPHKDIVTDASSLHNDDFSKKEKAAEVDDEDRNEKPYTPPKKKVKPAEDLTDDIKIDTGLDDITGEDDEEIELEEDPKEEESEDIAPEDSELDSDEDEDYGDAETADIGDEKVEAAELDVDQAENDIEDIDNSKEELEEDKKELEELKNVATESLYDGGLSATARLVMSQRVSNIADKWVINTPTIKVGTESSVSPYQQTVQLISVANVATEGLASRLVDWAMAKQKTYVRFLTSLTNYGKSGTIDAERKLAKINSLLADWNSKPVPTPKDAKKLLNPDTPLKSALAMASALKTIDVEAIAGKTKDANMSRLKSLCGSNPTSIDLKQCGLKGDTPTGEGVLLGANVYAVKFKAKLLGVIAAAAESSEKSTLNELPSVDKRELLKITEVYRDLCIALSKPLTSVLQDSKVYQDALSNLNAAAPAEDNVVNQSFTELTAVEATIVGYYKAMLNSAKAYKSAIDCYLKNPKYSTVGTEGFFDNVVRLFKKDVNKVDNKSVFIDELRKALKQTVLNTSWWDNVECVEGYVTDASVVAGLGCDGYVKDYVVSNSNVVNYYQDFLAFDKAYGDAIMAKSDDIEKVADKTAVSFIAAAKNQDIDSMRSALKAGHAENDKFVNPLSKNKFKNFPISSTLKLVALPNGVKTDKYKSEAVKVERLTKEQIVELAELIVSAGDDFGASFMDDAEQSTENIIFPEKILAYLDDNYADLEDLPKSFEVIDRQCIEMEIGWYHLNSYFMSTYQYPYHILPKSIITLINLSIRDLK